jgi:hypothetical protein
MVSPCAHTLPLLARQHASTPGQSSPEKSGGAMLLSQRSGIRDHRSFFARRQTPDLAPNTCASRSTLGTRNPSGSAWGNYPFVTIRASRMGRDVPNNHNSQVCIANMTDHTQSSRLALQAASMPIDNSRFIQRGVLDCLTRIQNSQNGLSDASRGMYAHFLPVQCSIIHNCRLSIDACWIASSLAENNRSFAVPLLSFLAQKWVEIRKMTADIFSVFNLTKREPYLDLPVKLKQSGLDRQIKIWHSWLTLVAVRTCCGCSPAGRLCVTRRSRCAASKPRISKYIKAEVRR